MITLVQSLKFPSNKNIGDSICISGHITNAPSPAFYMNNSSMELVLFEKLHNIKLLSSVFRVTTFFQFDSTWICSGFRWQYKNIVCKISHK